MLSLKNEEMKKVLKDHGLTSSGNKEQLVHRLLFHEYNSRYPPGLITVKRIEKGNTRKSIVTTSASPAAAATTTTATTTNANTTTTAATENIHLLVHPPSTTKIHASTSGSSAVDKLTTTNTTTTTLPRPRKIPLGTKNPNIEDRHSLPYRYDASTTTSAITAGVSRK